MRKKLLLVEDSVTMKKVFELAFEQTDISVVAVDNGDDAVSMAAEIGPALVVADVTLPGKDGFEVAKAIAGGETTADLPVLILSGTIAPFDEERFKECGAKGVLFKPFETAELLEKVDALIGKREEAPAAPEPPQPLPPPDEHWDFSDVLDEADDASQAEKRDVPSPGSDAFPGEILSAEGKDSPATYDEFDVSLDEIEGVAAPTEEVSAPEVPAALEETVEIEEIEEIEEIPEIPETAAPEEEAAAQDAYEEAPETYPPAPEEPGVPGFADPEDIRERAEVPLHSAAAGAGPGEILPEQLKEQFVARAETIFRDVASEAVEKVMWEMMDRLTEEFSAKIRESVEAVAWEVIPATAEALIREEIARIRNQAGKPMSQ